MAGHHSRRASAVGGAVGARGSAHQATPRISPMHDRTHKGGAVLWFLRKHAPMPAPYETLDVMGDDGEFEQEPSKASRPTMTKESDGSDRRQSSGTRSVQLHQQAEFLHRTLMAIGVELQEARGAREVGAKPKSARHREDLRRCYAEHTDAECVQLRRRVAAREAEVTALRQQVEQLERVVQATRLAATRRSIRLRGSENGGLAKETSVAAALGVLRAKKTLTNVGVGVVFDAETIARSNSPGTPKNKDEREMTFEDNLQAKMAQQWETEQTMRGMLEEQKRLFDQQTIQRKANEAGLFGTHAEILKMRAKALRTEARVTRLANDLRRVYKRLPEVVRQKLQQSTSEREMHKDSELEAVRARHQLRHLKWLTAEELDAHIGISSAAIQLMTDHATKVDEILIHGDQCIETTLEKVDIVKQAMSALHEAWGKLNTRAPMGITGLTLSSSKEGGAKEALQKQGTFSTTAEQVQGLIQEALLLAQSMAEAAALLKEQRSKGQGEQQQKQQHPEEDSPHSAGREEGGLSD